MLVPFHKRLMVRFPLPYSKSLIYSYRKIEKCILHYLDCDHMDFRFPHIGQVVFRKILRLNIEMKVQQVHSVSHHLTLNLADAVRSYICEILLRTKGFNLFGANFNINIIESVQKYQNSPPP